MTTDSVLLIDNDPLFVCIVSQVLEAGGYNVEAVSSIGAAEAAFAERHYAAIILSLDLRDRNPEAFLRALSETDQQPIFVLVATHLDIQEMVRLYETGCVFNHRRKPLEDIGDLVRDLGRAIEFRMVKRQNSYLLTQLRDARDELHGLSEFMVQVEKAASFGWVSHGLVADIEAALEDAPGLTDSAGSGRVDRTHSLTELQQTLDHCRALAADARSAMRGPRGEFRPIEIAGLLSSVVRLHRSTLNARGVTLDIGPVDEAAVVSGDGPNLRLVITALLQNAAQAMPTGGRVTVSLILHGAIMHLTIKDTGPGMSTEVLARAFDPFYTTRKMGDGTGLGLTVAKEIVHKHGGEIILASVEGEGTNAIVTLPVFSASIQSVAEETAVVA